MSAPLLSVVIPTYNEEANIAPLLRALREALGGVDYEAIVVDDASKDATAASARAEGARVIVRTTERGLATAVVRGIREAAGTYVAVMDADFQHPPETVRRLLAKAQADDADVVIGSRYAQGGSEGNFGPIRRTISWGASLIGKLALPPIRKFGVKDPMSGLFLVRRAAVDVDALRPQGYKILLEILGRCRLRRVSEVGYTFQDRRGGESKLGAGVIVQYVRHVAQLGRDHPENRRAVKFALVGASGILVNLALLWLLHGQLGWHDLVAVPIAVEASIVSNFLLNDRFTFHDRRHDHVLQRLAKFNVVSLLALAINFGAYTILTRGFGVHYLLAQFLAILVAFGANYLGNLHWTYGGAEGLTLRGMARKALPWLPFLLLTPAAGFVYFHDIDRVPEIYFDEHYYVSVGRQIDNRIWEDPCWVNDGNLDHRPLNYEHPPLAKLLIAWSIMRFDTEHSVFSGCRDPEGGRNEPCQLVEHGRVISSHDNGKGCYDAFLARSKDDGDPATVSGNPLAWRLPSALLGMATVVCIGLAAQRLFGSVFAGLLGGTLVLLDTLVFTSARMALLDIFAAGFLAAAVYAATFPSRRGVIATAVLLALAFSCKYTVVFAGPGVALLSLWTQRRAGVLNRRRFDLNLAAFSLIPLAIWLLTYLPWWMIWIPDMGWAGAFGHWFAVQKEAFAWGSSGYQVHAYSSQPIEWIPMERPTWYYRVWELDASGGIDMSKPQGWVYAVGNPLLWWSFSAAAVLSVVSLVTGYVKSLGARPAAAPQASTVDPTSGVSSGANPPVALTNGSEPRWTASPFAFFRSQPLDVQASFLAAVLAISTYGFFFLVDRVTFLFYMTIVVPLGCLALAGVLHLMWQRSWTDRAVAAFVVLAILASCLYYLPVASADRILHEDFQRIMDTVPWMRE